MCDLYCSSLPFVSTVTECWLFWIFSKLPETGKHLEMFLNSLVFMLVYSYLPWKIVCGVPNKAGLRCHNGEALSHLGSPESALRGNLHTKSYAFLFSNLLINNICKWHSQIFRVELNLRMFECYFSSIILPLHIFITSHILFYSWDLFYFVLIEYTYASQQWMTSRRAVCHFQALTGKN